MSDVAPPVVTLPPSKGKSQAPPSAPFDTPQNSGSKVPEKDSRLPEKPKAQTTSHGGAADSVNFTFDGVPKYGPDGMKVPNEKPIKGRSQGGAGGAVGAPPIESVKEAPHNEDLHHAEAHKAAAHHHGVAVHHLGRHGIELDSNGDGGWYRAESGRLEQERKAWLHLAAIGQAIDHAWQNDDKPDKRFTNDPEHLDDLWFQEVVPFPPDDSSRHVPHERRSMAKQQVNPGPAHVVNPAPVEEQHAPHLTARRKSKGGCGNCGGGGCGECSGGGKHDHYNDGFGDSPQFGTKQQKGGCWACHGDGCQACGESKHGSRHQAHHDASKVDHANTSLHHDEPHESVKHARPWVRLLEYNHSAGPGCSGACAVLPEGMADKTHCGRVFQGELDNSYFVEALNVISLRPKLVRQLFYCWDIKRSIYIVSLFKNGTWLRVELDDFVPAGKSHYPYCCRSEWFPDVLWPSLVEKAYAKACTVRGPEVYHDSGGWEAIGGGGQVDEALADLTGGVTGSFRTDDVSPDRLFIYIHALQREALWVCRVHVSNCTKNGVVLNPFAHHAVNRAAHVEGGCYIQVFCAHAAGVHSGGLDNLSVPDVLWKMYPEKIGDGFTWMNINDFHTYFDVIFECRLVNSPDVGIEGMPPPRFEPNFGPGLLPTHPLREEPVFCEWIFANAGAVTERSPPEFVITLPQAPCEVIATVDQTDTRITQLGSERKEHTAVLLRVFQHIRDNAYSAEMVCKSNWMPVRGSMVAFKSTKGGKFKIIAEMSRGARCDRLIFRCYASHPGAQVSAATSIRRSLLAVPEEPALGLKWTLVGAVPVERLARADEPTAPPQDLDELKKQHGDDKCTVM